MSLVPCCKFLYYNSLLVRRGWRFFVRLRLSVRMKGYKKLFIGWRITVKSTSAIMAYGFANVESIPTRCLIVSSPEGVVWVV